MQAERVTLAGGNPEGSGAGARTHAGVARRSRSRIALGRPRPRSPGSGAVRPTAAVPATGHVALDRARDRLSRAERSAVERLWDRLRPGVEFATLLLRPRPDGYRAAFQLWLVEHRRATGPTPPAEIRLLVSDAIPGGTVGRDRFVALAAALRIAEAVGIPLRVEDPPEDVPWRRRPVIEAHGVDRPVFEQGAPMTWDEARVAFESLGWDARLGLPNRCALLSQPACWASARARRAPEDFSFYLQMHRWADRLRAKPGLVVLDAYGPLALAGACALAECGVRPVVAMGCHLNPMKLFDEELGTLKVLAPRLDAALRGLPSDAPSALVVDADSGTVAPTDRTAITFDRDPTLTGPSRAAFPDPALVRAAFHGRIWWIGSHEELVDAAPEFEVSASRAAAPGAPLARYAREGVEIRRLLWNPYVPGETPWDLRQTER